ncbi:hypothetical protein MRB53_040539 [Persea americana]|nr:hypothetical protein MRB53_040539 [Persea americana]
MFRLYRPVARLNARFLQTGQTLPSVKLQLSTPANEVSIPAKDVHVVVGIPAAFSPGCSQTHIPGYFSNIQRFKSKGVAGIHVISVNDVFVMTAYREQFAKDDEYIRFLADPGCKWTTSANLDFDASKVLGNTRCTRFAAIIKDGKVEQVFAEPDKTGITPYRHRANQSSVMVRLTRLVRATSAMAPLLVQLEPSFVAHLACYKPSEYHCVNGMLQYGAAGDATTVSGTNTVAGGAPSTVAAGSAGAGAGAGNLATQAPAATGGASASSATGVSPEQFAAIQSGYSAIGMPQSSSDISAIIASPSGPILSLESETATASGATLSALQTLIPELQAIAGLGVSRWCRLRISFRLCIWYALRNWYCCCSCSCSHVWRLRYSAIGSTVDAAQLSSILSSPSAPLSGLIAASRTASGSVLGAYSTLIPEINSVGVAEGAIAAGAFAGIGGAAVAAAGGGGSGSGTGATTTGGSGSGSGSGSGATTTSPQIGTGATSTSGSGGASSTTSAASAASPLTQTLSTSLMTIILSTIFLIFGYLV